MAVPSPRTEPPPERAAGSRAAWAGVLCCVWFVAQGLLFLPRLGIQYDEALFASGIYPPIVVEYKLSSGLPLMLMSYVGALKIWLYKPILALFGPSLYSLRVPMLLAGAVSIWLFFVLLRGLLGVRAALIGAALLATDSAYLLTACFDWGPVALQHLLLLCSLTSGFQTYRTRNPLWAFATGCSFGLALWDKALFIWVLAGLIVGAVIACRRESIATLRHRWVAPAALAGFLAGAAPLLTYDVQFGWPTFTENTHLSLESLGPKLVQVMRGLDGSSLFGYLVRDEPARNDLARGAVGKLSIFLSNLFGRPQSSLQFWAVVLAALSLPFWRKGLMRRVGVFAVAALATGIVLALITVGAGGSLHHYILFWPLPQLLVTASLAEAASRWPRAGRRLVPGAAALLCLASLLVTNQYFRQLIVNGPTPRWTDALYQLSRRAVALHPASIFIVEWGIYEPLRFLHEGRLPMLPGSDGVVVELEKDRNNVARLERAVSSPETLFFGYTDPAEVTPGVNRKLAAFAEARYYHKQRIETIYDRSGRPIYEVFRWLPDGRP